MDIHCGVSGPCYPHILLCQFKREGRRLGRWVQERIFSIGPEKPSIIRRYAYMLLNHHLAASRVHIPNSNGKIHGAPLFMYICYG